MKDHKGIVRKMRSDEEQLKGYRGQVRITGIQANYGTIMRIHERKGGDPENRLPEKFKESIFTKSIDKKHLNGAETEMKVGAVTMRFANGNENRGW